MAPDTEKARSMIAAFASVGAQSFDVTLTDIEQKHVEGRDGFRRNRSLDELGRTIGSVLQDAHRQQHSVIIRPRSTGAALIQLDDLDTVTVERIAPVAFMSLRTSPGNYQAWVAVTDAPRDPDGLKNFARRLRKGAGADHSATGATRIAGSLNFKTKYAPEFPMIEVSQVEPGRVTTAAALDAAGLLAAPEQPPASVQPRFAQPQAEPGRKWPDYQQALRGAPMKRDGSGPDRSLADFMFSKWASERGWQPEAIAARLIEVSAKAQERVRLKDEGYPLVTAQNAAAAVQRERGKHQPVKSTPRPSC
jgi:hypothetical protein